MAADRAKFNELHYNIDDTINSITQAASDLANKEAQDVSDINNAIQLLSDTHNKDVQDIRNNISDINNELDECVHIGDKTSLILFDELIGAVDDGTSVIKNGASISTAGDRKTKTDIITVDASKINLNTANLTNTLVSDTGIVFTDASAKKHTVMFDDTTKAITDAINSDISNIAADVSNNYVKLGPISNTIGTNIYTNKITQDPSFIINNITAALADGTSQQSNIVQSPTGSAIGSSAQNALHTDSAVVSVISDIISDTIYNKINVANSSKNKTGGTKSVNTITIKNTDSDVLQSEMSLTDNIIKLAAADAVSRTNRTQAFEIGMSLDPAIDDGKLGINTHYEETTTNSRTGVVTKYEDYNIVNSDGYDFTVATAEVTTVDTGTPTVINSNLRVSPGTITTTSKDSTKQAHTESVFNTTNAMLQVVDNSSNKLKSYARLNLYTDERSNTYATSLGAYNLTPIKITDESSINSSYTAVALSGGAELSANFSVEDRNGPSALWTTINCNIDAFAVDDTLVDGLGNPDPFRNAQQASVYLTGLGGYASAALAFSRGELLHGWYEDDFDRRIELNYVYNNYRDLRLLNSLTVKEEPNTHKDEWSPSRFRYQGTTVEGTTGYASTIFVDARYGKFGYNNDSWQQINNIVSLFIPTGLASKSYGTVTFTLYSAGRVKRSSDEFYGDYPGGTPITLHYGPEDVWTPTESGSDKLFVQVDFDVGNNYISTIKLEANASIGSEFYVDGKYLSYKNGNSGIYIEPSEYYLKLSDSFTSISIESGCIWAGRGDHWPSLKVSTASATLAACEGSSDGASLRVRQGDWRNPSCVDMWSNNWWWKRLEGKDVIAYGEFDISNNSVYTHFNWGLDLSATGTYNSNPIYGQVHLGVHHTHEVLDYTGNTSATASLQNGSNNYVRVGDDYVSLKCFNGFGVSTNTGIGLFDIETWTFTLDNGTTVKKQVLAAKKYADR